jgi:hypothetical protein
MPVDHEEHTMIRRTAIAALIACTTLAGLGIAVPAAGAATPTQCAVARHAWATAKSNYDDAVKLYRAGRAQEARLRNAGRTDAADQLDARLDAAQVRNRQLLQRAADAKERYQAVC